MPDRSDASLHDCSAALRYLDDPVAWAARPLDCARAAMRAGAMSAGEFALFFSLRRIEQRLDALNQNILYLIRHLEGVTGQPPNTH